MKKIIDFAVSILFTIYFIALIYYAWDSFIEKFEITTFQHFFILGITLIFLGSLILYIVLSLYKKIKDILGRKTK